MAPPTSAYAASGPASVAIYSTAGKFDVLPSSAQAILGDYVAEGLNHGRRVYRRRRESRRGLKGNLDVVLFFWDSRDGPDLSGWWLGDKVGGGQVWARNPSLGGAAPPEEGWKCPVDGPPNRNVHCVPRQMTSEEMEDEDLEDLGDPTAAEGAGGRPAAFGGVTFDAQRAAAPPPPSAPPPKRQARAQVLELTCRQSEEVPQEVTRVLGEYVQQGTNHGKRTFLKQSKDPFDEADPEVWLYYWDGRDGPDFSGWWLGRSVGGNEVYGWGVFHTSLPPSKGWRIPHSAAANPDITLNPKATEEEADVSEETRIATVQELVVSVESKAAKAVETASALSAGVDDGEEEPLEEAVRAVHELLEARAKEIQSAADSVGRHVGAARRARYTLETESELELLEDRIKVAAKRVDNELAHTRARLDIVDREREEERGAIALEKALPVAMELVTEAELHAEAGGDQVAAKAALEKASREVNKTLEAANCFAPQARKIALAEFTSLRQRCEAAELRLGIRKDSTAESAGGGGGDEVTMVAEEPEADEATAMMAMAVEAPRDDEGLPEEEEGEDAYMEVEADEDFEAEELGEEGGEVAAASRILDALAGRKRPRTAPAPTDDSDEELLIPSKKATKQRPIEEPQTVQAALELLGRAEAIADSSGAEVDEDWWRTQMDVGFAESSVAVQRIQSAAERAFSLSQAARKGLETQVSAVRKLPGYRQKAAQAELTRARNRLTRLQKRLEPLRELRTEYDRHLQVKDELDQLAKKVSAAELAIVHASDAESAPVVEAALAKVLVKLKPQANDASLRDAGALTQRRAELLECAQEVAAQFESQRGQKRGEEQQAEGEELLERANIAVEEAEAWLKRLAAAQAPWAEAEVLSEAEAFTALQEGVEVAAGAAAAAKSAQGTVGRCISEAESLSECLGVAEGLDVVKARLGAVVRQAEQLKTDTVDRRAKAEVREAVQVIAQAEAAARRVAEQAAPLQEDTLEKPQPPPGLEDAARRTLAAGPGALAACAIARKALTREQEQRQRGPDGVENAMLVRLAGRLRAAEAKVAGLKRAAEEAAGNRKVLEVQKEALSALEAQVEEAELMNLPMGDETEPSPEVEEQRADSVQAAARALSAWRTAAEALADNPHGAMKAAMCRLLARADEARDLLISVEAIGRPWRERALCRLFVRDAKEAPSKAARAVQAAEEAEAPFLKGAEVTRMPPAEASAGLAACEAAVGAAELAVGEGRALQASMERQLAGFSTLDKVRVATAAGATAAAVAQAAKASAAKAVEELSNSLSDQATKLFQVRKDLKARQHALSKKAP